VWEEKVYGNMTDGLIGRDYFRFRIHKSGRKVYKRQTKELGGGASWQARLRKERI